ncbi:uncharacterized protein JCM15063_000102 [Sporobolomyces koalae]|uniref:uncharacterized protein n=1 Tax=Sporobolomyces koalae TaxID=500713 RepID=UPI003181CEB9
MDPRIPATDLSEKQAKPVDDFIGVSPSATYLLNETHKDAPVMELCRVRGSTSGGAPEDKTCVQIDQQVTKVFAHLVKNGFFCQLPFDPAKTEIECIRINKIVERQTPH